MKNIDRTTVSVIACIISIFTAIATMYCDHRGFEHYTLEGKTGVHDIGHEIIPELDLPEWQKKIFEYGWIPFLAMAKHPGKVTTEIALVFATVMMIRLASITMTVLPSPTDKNATELTISKLYGGGVHDKIFSGHTAFATIVALAMIRHGVWNSWGYIYPMAMGLMMIATRGHYTVDVFLGFVIAYLVFSLFY